MKISALTRVFVYNGASLADPNPAFTLEQVRDFYSSVYAEILNAEIEGPATKGSTQTFTFRRAVGTKGAELHTVRQAMKVLNAKGTLRDQPPANEINPINFNSPVAKQVHQLRYYGRKGTTVLAPSVAQGVLP